MATSEHERGQKTESVQFWLCIAMVSLALHSGLIFTLQRWAKVAILQPEDGGPIAVELVDSPNAVAPNVETEAIASVPQKPEAKPQVKPEPEPEVVQQPDPKPESPIVPPVKPSVPALKPETPQKPKPLQKPSKKPPGEKPLGEKPLGEKPPGEKPPGEKPIGSGKPLAPPEETKGQDLTVNIPVPKLLSTPGEIGGKGTARLRLRYPPTVPFPATFSFKAGDVIRARVKFIVTGTDFQSPQIKELSPKLSGREKDQLLDLMYGFLTQISVEKIEIDTDAVEKPDTEWETTIELQL